MDKNKKVLLVGGNGFIGKYLKRYLELQSYIVMSPSSTVLDVTKEEDFTKLDYEEVDHVVHLAGKTFVPASWENPEEFFRVNTAGTLNVINFCRKNHINMTYISAYIYGQPKSNPINERAEVHPNNPYAKSKYMAEELCEFFCKYFEMNINILRLFNVYGPGQNTRFLIPYIIEQVLGEEDTIVVQDLEPKRDYIYIEDVCRAVEMSINKISGYQLYNIGSGVSYSVREIIDIIQESAGTNKKIISKNNIRKNEMNDVVADITHIENNWNWKPATDIKEGILKSIRGDDNEK